MVRSGYTIDDFMVDIKNRALRIDPPGNYNANNDWPEGHLGTYLNDMKVNGNPEIKNDLSFILYSLMDQVIKPQMLSMSQLSEEEMNRMFSELGLSSSRVYNRLIDSTLKIIAEKSIEKTGLIVWEYSRKGDFEEGKEEAFQFAEIAVKYINYLLEESEKRVPQELGNDMTKPSRLRQIII